jgi:hypothetical protein
MQQCASHQPRYCSAHTTEVLSTLRSQQPCMVLLLGMLCPIRRGAY